MEIQITEAENSLRKMKNQRDEIETDGKQLLNSMENITSELTDAEEIFTSTVFFNLKLIILLFLKPKNDKF